MEEEKLGIRFVKRYGNRKLYDLQTSRYITLDGIRELMRKGEDVRVVDNDSGEDLTRVTLAQIIYEHERRNASILSLPLLRWLVARGDEAMQDVMRSMERGREALESMREATEKRVQKIITAPQRQLDSLQQTIDAQVERMTSHPAWQKELRRIEQSVKELEQRLGGLLGKPTAAPKRSPARRAARGKKADKT